MASKWMRLIRFGQKLWRIHILGFVLSLPRERFLFACAWLEHEDRLYDG